MRVKRDGTRTIIRPVMEIPRWIHKALLTIIFLAQIIILIVNSQTPTPELQILSLALGLFFIYNVIRFLKASETIVTINHAEKTVTIQNNTFRKTETDTYPFAEVELRLLYQEPYPNYGNSSEFPQSEPICLEIKLPDHEGVIFDYDSSYVQWPVYLEKRAEAFAKETDLNLTYIARKPEVLLSDQYERQSNDEKYPRSL